MHPERIEHGEISLRAWRVDEADVYLEGRDRQIFEMTTESPDLDLDSCRANIGAALDDPSHAPFAIVDGDDRPVGNLAVVRKGDVAELSYWLAPGARGRGWAKRALSAATEWAFANWDIESAMLEIREDNSASIATATAAGYIRHGVRLESACGGPALLFRRPRRP